MATPRTARGAFLLCAAVVALLAPAGPAAQDAAPDAGAQALLERYEAARQALLEAGIPERSLARPERQLGSALRPEELVAELPRRIARAQGDLADSKRLRDLIEERHRTTRRRIASGGLTEGMGLILRRDYEWLPAEAELRARSGQLREQLSEAQDQLFGIEEQRDLVGNLETAPSRFLAEVGESAPSESLQARAQEFFQAQRELRDRLIEDLDTLTEAIDQQVQLDGELRAAADAYRSDVEGRIFWVRSSVSDPLSSLAALPRHLLEVERSIDRDEVRRDALGFLREESAGAVLLALLLAMLIWGRRFLKRRLAQMAELVRSHRTDSFTHTVRALLQTFLLALPMPLAAWALGWLLSSSGVEVARALGEGLRGTSLSFLVLELLRQLARPRGLGEGHFRWPGRSMASLRGELRWFEPISVAFALVATTFEHQGVLAWSDSIGRTAFVLEMVALAYLLRRLSSLGNDLLEGFQSSKGLLWRTHAWWSRLAVGAPIALVVLALAGYYYTATQLEYRLRYSLWLASGLAVLYGLLLRWLFLVRRRLAVAQAREKARARAEAAEAELEAGGAPAARESGSAPVLDEDRLDIPAVDAQTRQLFQSGVTLAVVLGLYFIWASALPALRGLDSVQLWPRLEIIRVGEQVELPEAPPPASPAPAVGAPSPMTVGPSLPYAAQAPAPGGASVVLTLADVSLALVVLLLTLVASKNVPGVLEISLLRHLPLDSGSRYAITTIVRYVILIAGTSATLSAMGLGWEKVQWLAAALTFGLAFGLQEIFANFVSGIIILLERPIRLGDIVTVAGTEGRVTRLRMRATTIQDWDRRELLVPNKEFITGSVVNWTLSDPITRIIVPVGVAYGSDVELARKLLLEVAQSSPMVLEDPAPSAVFRRFGDSSLDFELRVFMGNRDLWPEVVNRLHTEIDRAFREAGIEIAFPQRDLHIRSSEGLLGTRLEGRGEGSEPRDR